MIYFLMSCWILFLWDSHEQIWNERAGLKDFALKTIWCITFFISLNSVKYGFSACCVIYYIPYSITSVICVCPQKLKTIKEDLKCRWFDLKENLFYCICDIFYLRRSCFFKFEYENFFLSSSVWQILSCVPNAFKLKFNFFFFHISE